MSSANCQNVAQTALKLSNHICVVVTTGTPTRNPALPRRSNVTTTLSDWILNTHLPTPESLITTTGWVSLALSRLPNVPPQQKKRPLKQSIWIRQQRKLTAHSVSPPCVTILTGLLQKTSTAARSRLIRTTLPGIIGT